ncbi:MAG TPA: cobalamin-dependent protein [Clostridiales bacterium]|nr:cobalamin-dependent protein [Clostridiales bacterium]
MKQEKSLSELISGLFLDEATEKAKQMLSDHCPVQDIYQEVMDGLAIVGEKYNDGKCFIADLIVAGTLAQDIFALIKDERLYERKHIDGKMVIGTISGDIHDIGKDLICTGLRFSGVDVIDLGVDVSVERFVEAVQEYRPDLLGISTVIDSSFAHIKKLVAAFQQAGLAGDTEIVVGGSIADPRYIHLDGVSCLTNNYKDGVNYCLKVLEKKSAGRDRK